MGFIKDRAGVGVARGALALGVMGLALTVAAGRPSAAAAATCDDHPNQASAQRAKDTRDADGDGIYCEALPCPCASGGDSAPDPSATRRAAARKRAAARRKAAARRRAAQRRRAAARRRAEQERRRRYARFDQSSWVITAVLDGDTIRVSKLDGPAPVDEISVRLLGVDSPEIAGLGRSEECGARHARAGLLALAFTAPADTNGDGVLDAEGGDGRAVRLATDRSQDLYDGASRLLAYADTLAADLGRHQLRSGWAEVRDPVRRFRRQESYEDAAQAAAAAGGGVHGLCGGNFHAPTQPV